MRTHWHDCVKTKPFLLSILVHKLQSSLYYHHISLPSVKHVILFSGGVPPISSILLSNKKILSNSQSYFQEVPSVSSLPASAKRGYLWRLSGRRMLYKLVGMSSETPCFYAGYQCSCCEAMRHKAKTLQNLFSGRTGKENISSYTRYKEALLIVFVYKSPRINDTCPGPIYNWDNHDYEYYANQY